ncbi:NADP-dependent oxidoreductase [Brachybacterium sp. GCM10030267]|uniref:NADP-dependent oxidoreductase n=1 Tax=unclassified Brachybacterium TaxID=2623841 RepID=UPI003615B738
MRAIGVTEHGGPEVLHEIDVPAEDLGPGQVRVRVTAATVNPTDTGKRSMPPRDGSDQGIAGIVPGMDIAGSVVEVGPDTETDLAEGDRVIGIVVPHGEHGAYREEIVLPVGSVVRAPREANDAEAATLPMNGMTARHALDLLGLPPGGVLAVTGAAGALGGYLIQLAKADGLAVIADAAEKDEELVRSLGPDAIVPRGDEVVERIRELYPEGVDGLADGAIQNEQVLPAVKDGGSVATFRGYRGNGERDLRVHPVMVAEVAEEREKLETLRDQAEQGVLTLRVADVLPAGEAAEAHRRLEAGGVRGRLVLDFAR